MDKTFTKKEVVEITKIPERTFEDQVRKGWLDPVEQGGGHGKQSKYDRYVVAWAAALKEILRNSPTRETSVLLYQEKSDADEPRRICKLGDGKRILNYLRHSQHWEDQLAVEILTGQDMSGREITDHRISRIWIGPYRKPLGGVNEWFERPVSKTIHEPGNERVYILRSVTFVNLADIFRYVDKTAAKL